MNLRLLLSLALLALVACETTGARKQKPTEAERRGVAAVLAGEWVAPGAGDQYLLFKPDEMEPKSGRFGGWGEFNRYEIRSRLALGRRIDVELLSATNDTDTPKVVVAIEFSTDGRSLTLTVPSRGRGQAPTQQIYRKVVL
jgi:hypothetical protein